MTNLLPAREFPYLVFKELTSFLNPEKISGLGKKRVRTTFLKFNTKLNLKNEVLPSYLLKTKEG
jgi:hypothetical protein